MSNKRFMRTEMLLGAEAMQKLQSSTVMIVGLGAVGGYVTEALARSGVGQFILVDFDEFEESNINRQILALSSTIGQKKTIVAAQRIKEINPDAKVEIKDIFVNKDTLPELLFCKANYVIDAIDALNPKCDLIEALYLADVPFISSMGAALKTDPAKIKTGFLSNSKNCSLAKFIRKRLRKRGIDIGKIMCVFSEEAVNLPDTALALPEDEAKQGRTRHTLGSLPTITAIFGLTIANYVILKLSSIKK